MTVYVALLLLPHDGWIEKCVEKVEIVGQPRKHEENCDKEGHFHHLKAIIK